MNIRRITAKLHASDILIIGFAGVLTLIDLIFAQRIPHWWLLAMINGATVAAVCLVGYARHTSRSKLLAYVHDWYVAPMVFLAFKELYFMIKPLHGGRDYDDLLIAMDRWIFGTDPTVWLATIARPFLTEILQIAYTSFYLLFLILGYELYRRRSRDVFHEFMFTCVYGFFLSYIGYLFLPAVGPRFTLHNFAALDTDLPGLLLTPALRWFVNVGESVPMGVANAVAIAGAQRDVFPSGHTMLTLVLMYLAARSRARVRYFLYAAGTLLIIATVYERYHYVVDLLAGAACMWLCVATAPRLYAYTKERLGTMEGRLPPADPAT